jgi:hypothetical protein
MGEGVTFLDKKQGSGPPKLRCEVTCWGLYDPDVVIAVSLTIPLKHRAAPHHINAFHLHGALQVVTFVPWFSWNNKGMWKYMNNGHHTKENSDIESPFVSWFFLAHVRKLTVSANLGKLRRQLEVGAHQLWETYLSFLYRLLLQEQVCLAYHQRVLVALAHLWTGSQ